jgi:hypothetical protein
MLRPSLTFVPVLLCLVLGPGLAPPAAAHSLCLCVHRLEAGPRVSRRMLAGPGAVQISNHSAPDARTRRDPGENCKKCAAKRIWTGRAGAGFLLHLPEQPFAGIFPQAMANLRGFIHLIFHRQRSFRTVAAMAALFAVALLKTLAEGKRAAVASRSRLVRRPALSRANRIRCRFRSHAGGLPPEGNASHGVDAHGDQQQRTHTEH